jgi:ribosome biogenesis GTPase
VTTPRSGGRAGVPAGRDGVVVRVDRGAALVESGADVVRVSFGGPLLAAMVGDAESAPCTGDVVSWRQWPDGRRTIERVHARRTLLARGAASGTSARQLLAANVDVVAVVEGLVPDPDQRRLARLLSLAWSSGAEPVLLLTKADLAPDGGQLVAETERSAMCRVQPVSVVTGEGVAEVRGLLDGGRLMAMLGASGVGKSSLLNALAGDSRMRVRALRGDGKGRHTTVTRELHRVAGGGVIDGPGLRAVGLADADGLDQAFADLTSLAGECRFRDCRHEREPGCAVRAAIEAGELGEDRLAAWRQLLAEGRWQEIRRDARLRAEEHRRQRVMARALRRAQISRP